MQDIVRQIMSSCGYWGILFLIFIENIFPPIPSEVVLTFSGFMVSQANMSIIKVIIFATIGSTLGAIVLYLLGRLLNKDVIEKWLDGRVGKILRFKRSDVEKANSWFTKHGNLTVFFCRFIPIVRSLISIPAGMSKMNSVPFVILTALGSAVWNTALVILGNIAGKSWDKIAGYVSRFSNIVLVIILIVITIYLVRHFKKKSKKRKYNNKKQTSN